MKTAVTCRARQRFSGLAAVIGCRTDTGSYLTKTRATRECRWLGQDGASVSVRSMRVTHCLSSQCVPYIHNLPELPLAW
jgi:hypothetical protein